MVRGVLIYEHLIVIASIGEKVTYQAQGYRGKKACVMVSGRT
jgi:hypothetical protein